MRTPLWGIAGVLGLPSNLFTFPNEPIDAGMHEERRPSAQGTYSLPMGTRTEITPHMNCAACMYHRTAINTSVPARTAAPSAGRPARAMKISVYSKRDLPPILAAAGMVKLCGRPENRGSRLIGFGLCTSMSWGRGDDRRGLTSTFFIIKTTVNLFV